MNRRELITLFIVALALAALTLISFNNNTARTPESVLQADIKAIPKQTVTPTPTNTPTPSPKPKLKPLDLTYISDLIVTDYYLELEYLGVYYITAYSPLETGSWYTASGTYCHYADYEERHTNPTTCAVDPSLHHIGGEDGDLFYIPALDRCYIAEDTGGAVKGKHIDVCYTDDTLDSVYNFPTGYYEVYAVNVVYYDTIKTS